MTRTSAQSKKAKAGRAAETALRDQLKGSFLAHFRQHCSVIAAAEHAGVGRRTVYDWRAADPAFEEAFLDAEAEAWERLEHVVRLEAMPHPVERVKEEVMRDRLGHAVIDLDTGEPRYIVTERLRTREMNPTLAMFLLKAHDPSRYRERFDVEHSGKGGGAIPITLIDEIVAAADGKVSAA